ncbi:protein-glucosylgalactosylhydroxylysine glucosidase [Neolamprologus brichardi]|uniref:protein-glucosylgalactosylhydroxylysine glucosidase n=1 Tax=Neolamprologus brichardi TaxID=32507 RepID=UPI001643D3EB|nr:protein-glucosylgalactosylhydroxylysine glucosidase [Neolamprologus brichardi]
MSCDSDPYIFTTDTLPSDLRFLPPLANGHLGWRVYNNIMHMGGVYNGEGGRCHRADVPCPLAVKVELEEPVQHTYSLDTHKGIFIHTLSSASATATQSLYSHRHYPNLMVMEILLERQVTSQEPVTVKLVSSFTPQSKDIRFEGLKFPWESAVSGREVCPEDIYGQQEIHINGDVTLAFRHYLYLTEDLSMFREGLGSEVIYGVADYWVSRVTWKPEDQKYHLDGVMPPDEYYYNVNDSVYTNTVAKLGLQFAVELAELLQHPAPKEWQAVAEYIKIPFDEEHQYHPEYDGYIKGHPVKQADTVLLGYPLGLPMSPEVRRNDLEAYEPVTNPHGPAMTWGMFAIGWLELGEAEKAQLLLEKCFNNIQGPFQVWSESSDGSGAVNFLTGMGGFLQAVLFGYTGFRVQKDCLAFSPLLPNDVCELCVRGVNYLGSQMDWLLRKEEVCIILREQEGSPGNTKPCNLQVVLKASGTKIPLTPGQPVTFPREPGYVCKLISSASCWLF